MTNEEMLTDLKQFMAATMAQQIAQSEARMALRFDVLDTKLDILQDAIADTLAHAIEAIDTTSQVRDHEQRLRHLERHSI
jgi:hypothetical protein